MQNLGVYIFLILFPKHQLQLLLFPGLLRKPLLQQVQPSHVTQVSNNCNQVRTHGSMRAHRIWQLQSYEDLSCWKIISWGAKTHVRFNSKEEIEMLIDL